MSVQSTHSMARVVGLALLLAASGASADFVGALSAQPVTAPVALSFSNNTFSGLLTSSGTVAAAPYNFIDHWNFTLAADADVGGFTGTFNFTDSTGNSVTNGIDNLQMRLLGPSFTLVGWRSVNPLPGIQQVISLVSPTFFRPGNYAVEVRGTLLGNASSYAGTLQAQVPVAVPVPAALPLLSAGLLGLAGFTRRRKPRWA